MKDEDLKWCGDIAFVISEFASGLASSVFPALALGGTRTLANEQESQSRFAAKCMPRLLARHGTGGDQREGR